MSDKQDVSTTNEEQARQRDPETVLRPPVDIFENADGITLIADMPGVSKDRLNVQVDHESLVVEGEVGLELPQAMEALYADVRSTRYRRSFTLSGELDTGAIEAALKDGILRLHIPKRAEVRPRKIEVSVG